VVDVANCLTSILRQQTRGFEFSVPIHHKIQRSKRTLSTAMMMKACVIVLLSLLPLAVVQGFAPPQLQRSSTQLAASTQPFQKLAGAFLATTTILSNVVWFAPPQPADAASFFDDSSSTMTLAARSGGRAGGRAAPRMSSPSSSSSYARPSSSSSSTRVIERQTTIIQQPSTVLVAPPPVYGGGFGGGYYAPQPSGLGLAIGLNAVSGIAEGFREARQENEIRSTRDQLTEARIKEAEMEARLRALESAR
jgi:hypothetical protein